MEVGAPEPIPNFSEQFKRVARKNSRPGNWKRASDNLPPDIKTRLATDPAYSGSQAVIEAKLRKNNPPTSVDGEEVKRLATAFETLVEECGIDVSTEEAQAALPWDQLAEKFLAAEPITTTIDKPHRLPTTTKKDLVRTALLAASIAGLSMGGGISPANADVARGSLPAAIGAELIKKIKPPSLEERVRISFEQAYLDANSNQCFRTVRLTSPETGKSIGDVLVFNDLKLTPAQFEAACQQVFPRVNFGTENPKFVKWSKYFPLICNSSYF